MEKYFHYVCKVFHIEILLLTAHAIGRFVRLRRIFDLGEQISIRKGANPRSAAG